MTDKLISIKEFKDMLHSNLTFDRGNSSIYKYHILCNYIDLMERTLTLGDFVPCDLDGNVLEEPEKAMFYSTKDSKQSWGDFMSNQYKQAQQRVLFKGFKYIGQNTVKLHKENEHYHLEMCFDTMQFSIHSSLGFGGGDLFGQNIASLIYTGDDIELTQAAKDLITK